MTKPVRYTSTISVPRSSRMLHLERIVRLNITLFKYTLCIELDQFFDWLYGFCLFHNIKNDPSTAFIQI